MERHLSSFLIVKKISKTRVLIQEPIAKSHSRCIHFPLENEHSGKHMFVLTPENKRVAIGVKIDILIHFENLLHRQGMG
jgi:hypothetical protein